MHFNNDLHIEESDYIGIYKVENMEEVLNFLCKPMPFCRYCYMSGVTFRNKWNISKRDIEEWT